MPAEGSRTKLFFLNIGLAEPITAKDSFSDVMHRGQILSLDVGEAQRAMEIIGHDYMPDGIGEN